MPGPKFSPLSPNEQKWVQQQFAAAGSFIALFSPNDANQPITLDRLDRAFAAWLDQNPQDINEINAVINVVGVCFGQFLVKEAGFQWVIATDNHGSDLAVLALPGSGDVLIYPANFVAKRWERREKNFLTASFAQIRSQVASVAAQSVGEKPRPRWKLW